MSKAYFGAFVAIAVIAVGAVDYINQAKTAGSAAGHFSVGDYVSSIPGRFIGQKAASATEAGQQAPLAMAPRDHSAAAPDGRSQAASSDATEGQSGARRDIPTDTSASDALKQDKSIQAAAPAATAAPVPAATARGDDGIVGNILSAIGFGGAEPAMTGGAPIVSAAAKSDVKVNAFGAGSCKQSGAIKRCSIGN